MGEDSVSIDDEILRAHGYSEWANHNIDKLPVAVVFPSTTDEVSKMVKICQKYKVPMSELDRQKAFSIDETMLTRWTVPFSGGSSIEGNFAAPFGGMSFDLVNMGSILELHAKEYV